MYTYTNEELDVELVVGDNSHICFAVNGEHDWENHKNKVAITRWLLMIWKELQQKEETFYCTPYEYDGFGEYRRTIYRKLGFKQHPQDVDTYYWGTLPK